MSLIENVFELTTLITKLLLIILSDREAEVEKRDATEMLAGV